MHVVYIDDSGDQCSTFFSALIVPVSQWRTCFECIRDFRQALRKTDGIYVHKEFHATEFVGGRGHLADRPVTKERRCQIFRESLMLVSRMPGVRLINASFPAKQDERAFERLLNRIQRNMLASDSHAIIISDEGKEHRYTRLRRRMAVHNPIPSQFGQWQSGGYTKNIVIDRVVEDIVFKQSSKSYFIQMADFCAYSLLRWERPLPSKSALGLDKAFEPLKKICVAQANRRDPMRLGILRP